MIIRIHSPDSISKNAGGSSNLIEYLEKENRNIDALEHEYFFNNHKENIDASTAERMLDGNKGRLSKEETKFYMLTVNPSERELTHINNDPEKLKSYVNDLMDSYTANFNRVYKDGTPLTGKDIMYFAKVENERSYKFGDKRYAKELTHNTQIRKEIIKNLDDAKKVTELKKRYIRNSEGTPILEGAKKDGNNMHVHIVVSRYDYKQKLKLSPLSNQRDGKGVLNGKEHSKGFNRDKFVSTGERVFDEKFDYSRDIKDSYNYRLNYGMIMGATNPKAFAKMMVKRAILESIQDKTMQKAAGIAVTNPKHIPKKFVNQVEKQAIKAVMQALDKGAYTNPVTAAINITKKVITQLGKGISRAASI
ncbi:MAG: MobB family relaxase [Cellulophaga sp.]